MNHALVAALLSTCVATQVNAESWLLNSYGHWNVYYEISTEGVPTCVAGVGDTREVYFSLDVTKTTIEAWYISDHLEFGPSVIDGRVTIQIDANVDWDTPALASGSTVRMYGLVSDFIVQIANGRKLYIDHNGDGVWDAWVSLNGSSAAIDALMECHRKLGPAT